MQGQKGRSPRGWFAKGHVQFPRNATLAEFPIVIFLMGVSAKLAFRRRSKADPRTDSSPPAAPGINHPADDGARRELGAIFPCTSYHSPITEN
jgi:hypothetical protein